MPKKNGKPTILRNSALYKHVCGEWAVSVYAGKASSKFLCFDLDDGNPDTVRKVLDGLEAAGIVRSYAHISTSGSKGYHVDVLFDGLMYTDTLKRLYDFVIHTQQLNPAKVEFRPTHRSCIKLPLTKHPKSGNMCWFLDRETLKPIEDMLYLEYADIMPTDEANRLIDTLPDGSGDAVTPPKQTRQGRTSNRKGKQQPKPLVQGQRHRLMTSLAVAQRYAGKSKEECTDALKQWFAEQDRTQIASTDAEVYRDILQIVRWAYKSDFHIVEKDPLNEVQFTPSIIRAILSLSTPLKRKLMFLYFALTLARRTRIQVNVIADVLGKNRDSVTAANYALETDGYIRIEQGKREFTDKGTFYTHANRYIVTERTMDACAGEEGEQCATVSIDALKASFSNVYYTTIKALIPENEFMAVFKPRERREYQAEMEA